MLSFITNNWRRLFYIGTHKVNPFKPEFIIVIFIHYKPRIAVAIFDLWWMKMI